MTENIGDCKKGYNPIYDEEMAPVGFSRPDAKESISFRDVWYLKMYESYSANRFLVLVPATDEGSGPRRFRRIGMGYETT